MNANESYYRKITGAIGVTMLFFLLFINCFGLLHTFLDLIVFTVFPNSPVACEVTSEIIYAAGYLASFMCPVAILRWRLRRAGCEFHPMYAAPRVSPWIFLMIPACVTVVFAAAYINAQMVSFVDYSSFSSEYLWDSVNISVEPYRMVLDFIVVCVVPGFCEEFLFRGAILPNCRPFGRTNAILISSLLFSTMHQNPEQLFYTFVAGLMLGVIYEKTESIWNCTLIHIFINFISTYEGWIGTWFEDIFQASVYVMLFELALFIIGILSLFVLIRRFFGKQKTAETGIFGRPLKADDRYAQYPISSARAVRLFITPSTVAYFAICALQVLTLFLMALVI